MNVVSIRLVVGMPDTNKATECPDCGFDSLLAFPMHLLSDRGVTDAGAYTACPRCWEPTP